MKDIKNQKCVCVRKHEKHKKEKYLEMEEYLGTEISRDL